MFQFEIRKLTKLIINMARSIKKGPYVAANLEEKGAGYE